MRNLIIFGIIIFSCVALSSQDKARFDKELQSATNFHEVMKAVNSHYENLPDTIRENGGQGFKKEKHWRRWEWWASSHLGANGSFVNVNRKTQLAIEDKKSLQALVKSTNSSWSQIGPTSSSYQNTNSYCKGNGLGRIDRIAFHPSSANTVFVGTPSGGIWKTSNGGSSWNNLTTYTPSLGVSGLVIDHSNTDIIYALTGDGDSNITNGLVLGMDYIRASIGVMKSIDGGQTWAETGPLSPNLYYGYQLVMDPNDSDVLFAATTDGLWRTTNGGDSWTEVVSGFVYDVAFKPGSSTKIYSVTDDEFKYSSNGGTVWNDAFVVNAPVDGRKSIAVTEDNVNAVYVLCGSTADLANNTFGGFYRSSNGGVNYVRQTNSPNILDSQEDGSGDGNATNYILAVAAKHSDEDKVITASLISFKSPDKGVTWSNATTYWEDASNSWYVHPDLHDIEYNPLDDKLYVVGDGGIHVSTNDGTTWTDITSNINTNQAYHFDQYEGSSRLLTGNQDNGLKYRISSGDFEHVHQADGFYTVFDPNNNSRFYSTINDRLYKFTNGGSTRSSDLSPTGNFFNTVEAHNTDQDIILCGGSNIHKSSSQGSTWSDKGASGSWAITACPSNNSKFYATGFTGFTNNASGKAYISTDTGESWNDLSGNPGFPSTVWKLTDILPWQLNSARVWMTCGGYEDGSKVYYSADNGNTWINRSANLPNIPIHCIALTDTHDAYIGTDIGVFYRANGKTDWIPFSNGLPNVPVTDIRLDHTAGSGNIYISTFGAGIWWDSISDNVCSTNLTLSNPYEGFYYYEASNTIETTSEIVGSIGNEVYMSAGTSVTIKPGFKAKEKAKFKAYIGPCGDGIPTFRDESAENSKKVTEEISNVFVNKSKFDINSDSISFYIKKAGYYDVKLLDVHFKERDNLGRFKWNVGEHAIENLIFDLNVNQPFHFVGLYENNKLLYLQEVN